MEGHTARGGALRLAPVVGGGGAVSAGVWRQRQPGVDQPGKDVFRTDTFSDEVFWTDTLRMHEVIATAVDPVTALRSA